jgi:hypothetical protein
MPVIWPMLALLALTTALLFGSASAASTGSGAQPAAPPVHALQSAGPHAVIGATLARVGSGATSTGAVTHHAPLLVASAGIAIAMLLRAMATTVNGAAEIQRRRLLPPHRRGPPNLAFTH